MTVKAYGGEYLCESYKKYPDSLLLFDAAGDCIASFAGISTFAGYEADGVPMTGIPALEPEVTHDEMFKALLEGDKNE
jgi:hypothetical protein